MTPKEKAKELFDSYYWELENDYKAKQCALITINQMLWVADWYERRYKTDSVIQYLKKVKQEIEKL